MRTEFTIYINEVDRIEIERVPDEHRVRIVIRGADDDSTDARITCWSDFTKPGGPRVVMTTTREEPEHASDVAVNADD